MNDPYDLQRFIKAQGAHMGAIEKELSQGKKTSHWMWYVFPQLAGLGRSATAEMFAIKSRSEAEAYLSHPELGDRLVRCTRAVLKHQKSTANAIFGYPDNLKFHSCMTLFNQVADDQRVFSEALKSFFNSEPDEATLSIWNSLLR